MRFTLGFVAVCLAMFSGIAALGSGSERSNLAHSYDNLLRLHVIAHSDLPEEQRVKLLVRDALIAEMATWPAASDRRTLEENFLENRSRLESIAVRTLRREGFSHGVSVEVGEFAFPEKRWGALTLPAGDYRAVRVVIGDGAGQNWWCVLFPPLCFVEDAHREVTPLGESSRPPSVNTLAWAAEAKEPGRSDGSSTGGSSAKDGAPPESGLALESSLSDDVVEGNGSGRVAWRLRLWESFSESAYAGALRGLIEVAMGKSPDR